MRWRRRGKASTYFPTDEIPPASRVVVWSDEFEGRERSLIRGSESDQSVSTVVHVGQKITCTDVLTCSRPIVM